MFERQTPLLSSVLSTAFGRALCSMNLAGIIVLTCSDMTVISGSNTSTNTLAFIALLVWNDQFKIIGSNFQSNYLA